MTPIPEERAAGRSGLQSLGDGKYQFNWKTPKHYAGSCMTLHLDLGEGFTRTATFRSRGERQDLRSPGCDSLPDRYGAVRASRAFQAQA